MSDPLFHGDLVSSQRILYTPSAFAKLSLNHLQEVGRLQAQRPHVSRRENLSSYLFFMVESGAGVLEYGGALHTVRAGDCVFIDCHHPYYHKSSSDLWKLEWAHFNGPTLANIYAKYVERGGAPRFHPQNPEPFRATLAALYRTAAEDDYIRDMRLNELLTQLLTLLMAESWRPDAPRFGTKKQNLLQVKEYLDEHYPEKITLDALAEQFFINKFYLTRVFREQFGLSVNSYLLQIRITHAKQLLRFTDQSVESIGAECGLGALYYFSRMFKKVEGIGPREYRKLW